MRLITGLVTLFTVSSITTFADGASRSSDAIQTGGASGIWILANVSYAGMRAQANPSVGWRILAFVFGFPGTLVSFLAITEGGERAYGIDVPRKLR
jgi:hypothetical protein